MKNTTPSRTNAIRVRLAILSIGCVAAVLLASAASSSAPGTLVATAPQHSGSAPRVIDGTYMAVHATPRLGAKADAEAGSEDWLRTTDGRSYRLQLPAGSSFQAGQALRVRGSVSGNLVTVAAADAIGTVAASGATSTGTPAPISPTTTTMTRTPSTGVRKVLIMLVTWTGADGVTPASAQAQVANTDNAWYQSVSSRQVGFTATSTPWMTLPASDCSLSTGGYWKVLAAAEAQAKARGFDPAAYDHEMVYFPFDTKCAYAGLGAIGQRASWINGEMDTRVTVHELGHNLGLHHSHALTCNDATGAQVTLSANCTSNDYGDLFDVMGMPANGSPRHFNSIQMNQLGWFAGRSTTVTASTSVVLAPLEAGTGVAAARIVVGGTEYWLEYRTVTGVDSALVNYPQAVDGILIHRLNADGSTELLDGRPDASRDFGNAALPVAATWTTPEGIRVRVNSVTVTNASAQITFPSAGSPVVAPIMAPAPK